MHKAASETYHETCSAFLLREVIWIIMRFKFSILLKEFENFGFLMISIASILLSTYYTSYLQYDQKCIFISSYPAFLLFLWDQEQDPVDRSLFLWLMSFLMVIFYKKIEVTSSGKLVSSFQKLSLKNFLNTTILLTLCFSSTTLLPWFHPNSPPKSEKIDQEWRNFLKLPS